MEHPPLRKAAEHGGILSARRRPIMIGDTDLDALFTRLHLFTYQSSLRLHMLGSALSADVVTEGRSLRRARRCA